MTGSISITINRKSEKKIIERDLCQIYKDEQKKKKKSIFHDVTIFTASVKYIRNTYISFYIQIN